MLSTYNLPIIPELAPYVNNIWVVEAGTLQRPHQERLIPYGCMDLVFLDKEGLAYSSTGKKDWLDCPKVFMTGQISKPYFLRYDPGVRTIGIGFYPHTAHLFTQHTSGEFSDQLIDAGQLGFAQPLNELVARLEESPCFSQKVKLLQDFVWNRIQQRYWNDSKNRYTQELIQKILLNQGSIQPAKLSRCLGISQRYIQQLFKEYVGLRPGLYSRVIRFLNSLPDLGSPIHSLTEVSHNMGYFDQAHFIRDFKSFTGLTPGQYVAEQHQLLDAFTALESSAFLYNSLLEEASNLSTHI